MKDISKQYIHYLCVCDIQINRIPLFRTINKPLYLSESWKIKSSSLFLIFLIHTCDLDCGKLS